ncbi:MAG: alpha/beta hydrolase [Planctomycetota bacterium]|nr:alpha/beta hydrolase [Planctomycetota bacterium]MDA1163943.1 alpha/beta hydrolase [Planctomycetota bacterium]
MQTAMKLFVALAVGVSLPLGSCATCFAQAAEPVATHKDIAYDTDHTAQCLDVYLAKSDKPVPVMIHIHGGGWRAGSKNHVPRWLKQFVADGQMSLVSVEYRFTDVAPHPAQVNDCQRAIQFVRHNAAKWNINPERIGVTGGSAGGHLSAWVALHDDAAKPESKDPIERHSSRVACAVSFAGPTDWSLLSKIEHRHPAYRQLIGYEPGTPAAELSARLMTDVSPVSFASKDDPPLMQVHGDNDDIVPVEHAKILEEKLKSVGSQSELVVIPGGNHGVSGASDQVAKRAIEFVRQHLLKP